MRPSQLGLVAAGGAVGACARYGLSEAWPTHAGQFPATTLAINLAGAFVLGVLLAWLTRAGRPDHWMRFAIGIGAIGAFTTFSTFATETVLLVRDDHAAIALAYAVASVVGGIVAVLAGLRASGWRRQPLPEEGES